MMDALVAFKASIPPTSSDTATGAGGGAGAAAGAAAGDGSNVTPPSVGVAEVMMFGVIGTILTGSVLVYVTAGAVLLLNHIFLIILLVLGPMFVAMAAFKMTREYAKKWMVKTLTIALTLALVTGMLGFVLKMQGTFSGSLCQVVGELQNQMKKHSNLKPESPLPEPLKSELEKVQSGIKTRLLFLHALAVDYDSPLSFGSPNQKLVEKIQSGCSKGMSSTTDSDTNLLFVAMQFLVICMLFNRLLTEAANIASALVGASGVNSGSQEVSGGLGGMAQRGGLKGKGTNVGSGGINSNR